jgi:hypothetical protein
LDLISEKNSGDDGGGKGGEKGDDHVSAHPLINALACRLIGQVAKVNRLKCGGVPVFADIGISIPDHAPGMHRIE